VVQPGRRFCPLERGDSSVELTFYASPDAAPLAVADIEPGGCGGVSLTIGGVSQPRLEGGWSLIGQIGKALGVNPTAGPPVDQNLRDRPSPKAKTASLSAAKRAIARYSRATTSQC
jgi:hypothetical protein